jgi:hypothetical protein
MSTTAGAIRIHSRSAAPRSAWRVGAMVAVLSASAATGVYVGRASAPSVVIPAVRPAVRTGPVVSTRPLSDASFSVGGARFGAVERPAARSDTPVGIHGRQVAR